MTQEHLTESINVYVVLPLTFTDTEMAIESTQGKSFTFMDMLHYALEHKYIDEQDIDELLQEYTEEEAFVEMAEVFAVHEQLLVQTELKL